MATRKPRRNEWRCTNGKWVRSLGSRGARIRLFQNRRDGVFYRAVWLTGRGKDRRSLGTSDRTEAERLGRELLAALLREDSSELDGAAPLSQLWERYRTECPAFLDNEPRTRTDDAQHVAVLIGFFGEDCDVRNLTEQDVRAFAAARSRGGIVYQLPRRRGRTGAETAVTKPARARSAEVEIRILKTILRWATTVRVRRGQRLLAANPLAGVRGVRERNPRRPLASWERFEKTRAAIRQLAELDAPDPVRHQEWIRLELALVLAEGTGRRIGSIRQLRWDDFDFGAGTVRWRAEADKRRVEWPGVPLPAAMLEEVRRFRARLGGAFGGLVFPSRTDAERPMGRELLDRALARAERHAGLAKLDGGLWHAYRRKWASERKHLPLVDVAAAGGWKDTDTLVTCYQHADRDTMLAVMSEPRKVTEKAGSG
jgi:integrase